MNSRISIPASIALSGKPFIGFYDAKKTLPLKREQDSGEVIELSNYVLCEELSVQLENLRQEFQQNLSNAIEMELSNDFSMARDCVLASRRYTDAVSSELSNSFFSHINTLSTIIINETLKVETKINEIINSLSSLSDQISIDVIPVIDPTDPSEEGDVDPVTPPPVFSITELIYYLTLHTSDYIDQHNPYQTSEAFIKGLLTNGRFNEILYNNILEAIANNYAEISSGTYVSAVYASKEELSSVRDELIERIDSCQDTEALDRISALEEEVEKLKKERNSLILETWDPFALSDITDTRGSIPHTRDFLSNYVVDLCSDFTMDDMEGSFYGIHGMLNGCYFSASGKEYIPSIPYEEEVTATYEVNAFKYHYVGPITAGQDYYWLSGAWRKFADGDIVEFNINKNREDWISHGSSSGADKFFIQESENWTYLSSHIVEETASVGPTFNHLRKTYNAIVSAFLNDDDNFEILFDEHNVKILDKEETTMDILQGAMNNLIYTLSGAYNAHTDLLYQGTLRAFVSNEDYTLDSVAAALKSVITILQNK